MNYDHWSTILLQRNRASKPNIRTSEAKKYQKIFKRSAILPAFAADDGDKTIKKNSEEDSEIGIFKTNSILFYRFEKKQIPWKRREASFER